jgi:NifU-like protein involved in Fe-S cluster formation
MRDLPGSGAVETSATVVTGAAGDIEQGAAVHLEFGLEGDRVDEARFRAFGCPHFIAAASWLTERLRGCRRTELEQWDWREAAAALDVPPAKFGRLLTLQDAVRDAARNWAGLPQSTV